MTTPAIRIPTRRRNNRTTNGRCGGEGGVSDIVERDYKKVSCASMRTRALLPKPVPPAERITQRANFAAFIGVDDLDGHKGDAESRAGELDEDLGLDFKALGFDVQAGKGRQMQQAESALRIGEAHPGEARKLPAHETVGDAPHEGHEIGRAHV